MLQNQEQTPSFMVLQCVKWPTKRNKTIYFNVLFVIFPEIQLIFSSERMPFHCRLTIYTCGISVFFSSRWIWLFVFAHSIYYKWAGSCERFQGFEDPSNLFHQFIFYCFCCFCWSAFPSIIRTLAIYNIHFYSVLFRWMLQRSTRSLELVTDICEYNILSTIL